MSFSYDAEPGGGLDVDGDPETCSPVDDCEGGVDNQMALLQPVILTILPPKDPLQNALELGQLVPMLWADTIFPVDAAFELTVGWGVPLEAWDVCNFQEEPCDYLVLPGVYDPFCLPVFLLSNAVVQDGVLSAGGPGFVGEMLFPLSEGENYYLPIYHAQIRAQVQSLEGDGIALDEGLLAGTFRLEDLFELIDVLAEDVLPADKDAIKEMLADALPPDMDTDDDGELDAASFGVRLATIPGMIVGQVPEATQ